MAADFTRRVTSRILQGVLPTASRRAGEDRVDLEGMTEELFSDTMDLFTVDDLVEPTIERKINRTQSQGRVFFPVVWVIAGPDLHSFVNLALMDEIIVGRDPKAGLCLSDPGVSRRHAVIRWREDGKFEVHDLGSTNGVEIDGELVDAVVVEPGTKVNIVNVTLMLALLEAPQIDHMKRMVSRLAQADGHDNLTGLHMRSWLDDKLPNMVTRAQATGHYLCCLFLDLDHFKLLNDRFGHLVGDQVLQQAARLGVASCRLDDVWVRYGGEELVAFMPNTDEEKAWVVAERVRQALLSYDWSRTHPDLQVTASIGTSRLHPGESVESWLNRADQAMYLAKRSGRNRVERAD